MTRDDILEHLFFTRRALTILVTQTAQHVFDPTLVKELLAQRDRVVWLINRIIASEVLASLAGTEAAAQALAESTAKLEHLKATDEDIAKALAVAKTVITAAGTLAGHVI